MSHKNQSSEFIHGAQGQHGSSEFIHGIILGVASQEILEEIFFKMLLRKKYIQLPENQNL